MLVLCSVSNEVMILCFEELRQYRIESSSVSAKKNLIYQLSRSSAPSRHVATTIPLSWATSSHILYSIRALQSRTTAQAGIHQLPIPVLSRAPSSIPRWLSYSFAFSRTLSVPTDIDKTQQHPIGQDAGMKDRRARRPTAPPPAWLTGTKSMSQDRLICIGRCLAMARRQSQMGGMGPGGRGTALRGGGATLTSLPLAGEATLATARDNGTALGPALGEDERSLTFI